MEIFLGGGKTQKGWVRPYYARKSGKNRRTAKENGWGEAKNDRRSNENWTWKTEVEKEGREAWQNRTTKNTGKR